MMRAGVLVVLAAGGLLAAIAYLPQLRSVRAAVASLLIASSLLPESMSARLAAAAPAQYPSPACSAGPIAPPPTVTPAGMRPKADGDWKPVRIGAGGWLTGIDVASDGTMVGRTDTYGAYRWTGSAWQQLVTAASMSGASFSLGGVYELRIAPSQPSVFFLQNQDGIWRSVDSGRTFQKTGFAIATNPNGPRRMAGQKMAIDPRNPNIVYAGTQKEGLWRTRDGGSRWERVADVPPGSGLDDGSLTGIVISDRTIFVATAGAGVYRSQDGGGSWQSVGGPAAVRHAVVTADGAYLASQQDNGSLWRFANGAWTQVAESAVHAIAVDPRDPNHIVVTNEGGTVRESRDQGKSWGDFNWAGKQDASADIPWLDKSGGYMSSGGLVFDPKLPNTIWQSAGVGAWTMTLPDKFEWNTPLTWRARSRGIEQLVSNEIAAPPGGSPVFASWDRPFFAPPSMDAYATCYGGGDFSMGWSVDYASSDPKVVVGISDWWGKEESGISRDGGRTWEKFAGLPSWAKETVGGAIAASTPLNMVWVPAGGKPPAYTLDGGKSWQDVTIAGVNDWKNLYAAYYLNRQIVAADRVAPNTFYLTDSETGVYRSADGGRNWQRMNAKPPQAWSFWSSKLEAMPGRAGTLFFTSGAQGTDSTKPPGALPLVRSDDGGRSWKDVRDIRSTTFGFGAPVVAGGPAAIYVVGFYKDQFGVWGSPDEGRSWISLGRRPLSSLDGIKTVSGDMARPGRVYIGFGGSGYAYLDQ